MKSCVQPLVGIVTPVYNGEKYLAECIESVLAQTYDNWQYVIVNNCSTDRTQEIAQNYAGNESRLRIHNNKDFLSALENQNHALSLLPAGSKYAKIIHADDIFMPECLTEMVSLAEANPSVGIVGAYRLNGVSVQSDGLPFWKKVFKGSEICRAGLIDDLYVFGSPSSILISMGFILNRKYSYNTVNYHADEEACYEVLRYCDFGFLHQILTYSRFHNEQESSFARDINTFIISKLGILKKYGPLYLTQEKYEKHYGLLHKKYYRFLAKSLFRKKNNKFWEYHKKVLLHFDIPFRRKSYYYALILELLDIVLNPKNTAERILGKL